MSQQLAGVRPRLAILTFVAILASFGSAQAQSAESSGKIPITTTSKDAKQQYLKGRTLAENLRGQDSREFLTQATSKDPGMALAHYSLALSAPTAKDFFQHLNQAVALADKASDGERLMILGLQAGANADTRLQRDYYERLAAGLPAGRASSFPPRRGLLWATELCQGDRGIREVGGDRPGLRAGVQPAWLCPSCQRGV